MALLTMFTAIILHLLLLTPYPPMLKADDKLIQIECHNAEVPSTCIQCLQSDQHSQKADRVGIATIIVSCLKNHAQSLAANMSHLASGAKDKEMKNRFEECSQGFCSTMKELSSATIRLKKAKYDDAERSVNKALNCYSLNCQSIIQSYKNSPKHVVYSMRIYEELSEAANRVIERL
ncbi:hypothetical protein CMV_001973 [Castanea mollissima]|uniref:Pectinesterase inhibitor domain-containing protein n=1 Tax=Castanea mollissima TaxID=60419 RepID=A0A8J4W406_9ROSI|nr:hypothetical protein CMV_001973 [Castanea mollissima]